MNVAFDKWIPVVTYTGESKNVSLCEALTEGEKFSDLAVRPHERISLMRLFLCVAHASLNGPRNYLEWRGLPERMPATVQQYLTKWKDSFELFNFKKPWLQVVDLNPISSKNNEGSGDKKNWSPLSKLSFCRASGINTTLFDHESNGGDLTEYSFEEIALNLLTFQNFFVAGGKASSRVWGKIQMKDPPNPKGGPCSGKSILFTFLRGQNLFESICLNLNTYEDLKLLYGISGDCFGKPIWEMPIRSPTEKVAIYNATHTHIGRLVPQTRILRINKDRKRVLLGGGFIYPKFQDKKNPFHPDIFATVIASKDGERKLLSAIPNKSAWRELHALQISRKNVAASSRGPLCLLNSPDNNPCDIIVGAMITNPQQAAEIIDLVESVFHIPSKFRSETGVRAYESEVKNSEDYSRRLGWAVEKYRSEVDGGWEGRLKQAGKDKGKLKSQFRSIATRHYWTKVEKNLPLLWGHIEKIGSDGAIPARDKWRKMLSETAREAFSLVCGQETPRQIRAFALGWKDLTRQIKNKEKKAREETADE